VSDADARGHNSFQLHRQSWPTVSQPPLRDAHSLTEEIGEIRYLLSKWCGMFNGGLKGDVVAGNF